MFSFMIFCHVWLLHTDLIGCSENSTAVIQFSVPENHHICLQCDGSDRSDVVWTHQDRKVLVTRQGGYETNEDHKRFALQSDGGLCISQLDDSDSGKFHCNQQLVAELEVLTGNDFWVSAGRTLLLPCSGSSRPKKQWDYRRGGRKWETILTLFKNKTVKAERSRLSFGNNALQIQDLQPEDTGEYQCNRELQARLTVLTVKPEPTSTQKTTSATTTPAVMETDVVETKKKDKKRPENVLLLVAVVGLGLMIILLVAVCVLLTSMKCRKKKKYRSAAQRVEGTELQLWNTPDTQTEHQVYENPSLPEETIHYASLGRQNWRERPSRTPPDQDHHDVIYTSVITRPAAKHKLTRLQPLAAL